MTEGVDVTYTAARTLEHPDLGPVDSAYLWPSGEDVFITLVSRVIDPDTKDYSCPVEEEVISSIGHDPTATSDRIWIPKRLDLLSRGFAVVD